MSKSTVTSGSQWKWKQKIKNFKFNLWNQNLCPFITSLYKCSKQLTPTGSCCVNFRLIQRELSNQQFSMPYIYFIYKMFDLKLMHFVDIINDYIKRKWFWKSHFRSWDIFKNCFFIFSETVTDRVMIFSGLIDLSSWV